MESGPTSAQLYCLTIAFVGALLAFAFGTTHSIGGDRYDLLLFFTWATFIPWALTFLVLLLRQRRPPPL